MDWETFKSLLGEISFLLGGGSVVVFAFSGWLGKVWADRLMVKEKSQHDQELEKLRKMLETKIKEMEHSHQISQKTYQNLFEKKIAIYELLIKQKVEYQRVLNEDPRYKHEDNPKSFYYQTFNNFKNIIAENKLYVSDELAEKYDVLYAKILPNMNKLADDELHDEIDDGSRSLANDSIYDEIYSETSEEMKALLDQIDRDSKIIKIKIDLKNGENIA